MTAWTTARKKSFITSVLRGGSRRWPPRNAVLNASKTVKKINPKSGRMAQHYRCASCLGEFPAKEVAVDHVNPVVEPSVGFVDWNTFITRLYCDEDNMQVLCDTCHDFKSSVERKQR